MSERPVECCNLLVPVEVFNSLEKKHFDPILSFMYSVGKITVNPASFINSKARNAKEERLKMVPKELVCSDLAQKVLEFSRIIARTLIRNFMSKLDFNKFRALLKEVSGYLRLCNKVIDNLGLDPTRGCKESMYQRCLVHEFQQNFGTENGSISTERTITLWYPPKPYEMTACKALSEGYLCLGQHNRMDIEYNSWIFELKSIDHLTQSCVNQLKNYIRQTEYERGILINFNQKTGRIDYKLVIPRSP